MTPYPQWRHICTKLRFSPFIPSPYYELIVCMRYVWLNHSFVSIYHCHHQMAPSYHVVRMSIMMIMCLVGDQKCNQTLLACSSSLLSWVSRNLISRSFYVTFILYCKDLNFHMSSSSSSSFISNHIQTTINLIQSDENVNSIYIRSKRHYFKNDF